MARAKKEAALTPEERLQAALVPDWEWPYKLPENWCWTYQKAVCSLSTGEKRIGNDYPYWEVKCLRGITLPQIVSSGNFVPVFSKVILVDGENSGEVFTIFTSGYMGSTFKMLQISAVVFPKYLELFILSNKDVYRNRKTGSAIPHLNKELFFSTPFPLSPLAEQQRIIDRIESLFAKLDEAKEKAQAVVDSFETRKAAILHKAFTGELTAKWREENGVSSKEWTTCSLSKCCKIGSGGTPSRKSGKYYAGNIPWIKTGEIEWNEVVDSEEKISQEAIDNSSAKLYDPGAVLVAMYGMGVTRGRASILGVKAATNQAVCVLQPQEYLNNRYLFYFFMCNYWSMREQAVGGNQLNLSATIIGKQNIDIPPVSEQLEIVRILDNLNAKERSTKEIAETVIEQIDTLKKSILARAFRGELGTNDPSEESAVELLKQIF